MDRLANSLILILSGLLTGGLVWLVSAPPRGEPIQLLPPPTPAPIVVHVTGAVAAPGVYALPPGARVQDALEAAGGLHGNADLEGLNLAASLEDGDQVVVQESIGGDESPSADSSESSQGPTSGLIDINTASLEQLETLPGIGPSIAQRIIDYREDNGPFARAVDIVDVPGIGPATYDQIKDRITVGP